MGQAGQAACFRVLRKRCESHGLEGHNAKGNAGTVCQAFRSRDADLGGFRATGYDIPTGCCATYYPEANALMPLSHYAHGSYTPAAKSIPVFAAKD